MKSLHLILVCLLSLGTGASAANADVSQAQVSAATANAVDRLISDVLEERIGIHLTVRQFIESTDGLRQLQLVLAGAEPVGGPRWLDEQTCQVKLSIARERVLDVLKELATMRADRSPLPPEALALQLKDWPGKTFVATGIALSVQRAQQLAPPDTALAWRSVPQEARRIAVAQAAQNAATRTVDALRGMELAPGKPLAAAMDREDVRVKLMAYLGEQPLTGVQFRDDLSVEATLRPQSDELATTLLTALEQASVDVPDDPAQMRQFRDSINQRLASVVGKARAVEYAPPDRNIARPLSSQAAPEWTRRKVEITADAPAGDSRLKTARQAEEKALAMLRAQIESFALPGSTTVGAQARQDPSIARIVDDMMLRARIIRVDYLPDGSASVRLSFDPRDLWDELRQMP